MAFLKPDTKCIRFFIGTPQSDGGHVFGSAEYKTDGSCVLRTLTIKTEKTTVDMAP